MTYKYSLIGLSAALSLAACSTLEDRAVASGSFEYVKEQPGQTMQIPSEVDKPQFNDSYKLPDIGQQASKTLVGRNLSVLSPALVLPIVAGSQVEEGSKSATVWFDQVDDSQPLDTTIWNSLIRFLENEKVGIESFDKDEQRLITQWIVRDESEDSSWYSLTKSERTVGQRFEFTLDKKAHGRTASLSANLLEYKEKTTQESDEITVSKDSRRNEVDILNQIVKNYDFEIQVAGVKRIRQIRQGLPMELGFDGEGSPAFVVDADYEITWPRLLLVLRKLGFDVKDYDKSKGMLFVKYNGSEDGWWGNLWSSDKNELELDIEEYRVKVLDVGNKTTVTMLDQENIPFPVNKLTDLYPKFSKTMSSADLDI
jgi:outer membrane protein assembly factor BamC